MIVVFAGHKYLLAFLGALLIGEEAVFFLSLLVGNGKFPLFPLILFGFCGLIAADLIWFGIGKYPKVKKWRKRVLNIRGYKELRMFGKYLDSKHELLSFFLSKFVYGIRFVKLISASAKGMKLKKFIMLDAISILLWMIIMIPLGITAGRGFAIVFKVVHGIEGLTALFFFGLILIIIIELVIKKFLGRIVKKYFS